MTRSQQKLLDALAKDGEAWLVPGQMRMARILQLQGHILITADTRFNKHKNIRERRVVAAPPEREG